MHERSINSHKSKKSREAFTSAEATDSKRMGAIGQWGGNCPKISAPPEHTVSLEEGHGTRCSDFSERQKAQGRSFYKKAYEGEREPQGSSILADPGAYAFKKRDELGLTNRTRGCRYSLEQRQRIIEAVSELSVNGVSRAIALKSLKICRSTYYGWPGKKHKRTTPVTSLTGSEQQAVIEKKKAEPQMSHRRISGSLRNDGYWISPSSCYRILKSLGWVWPQTLREAPWKVPHYEPFRPNQIWGEDWTILTISGTRHYLLTIIDYFSRYIVVWGIVKTVTHREVQDLVALAYLSEKIDEQKQKPVLRADMGSPNIAGNTRKLIKDLEMVLSFSRPHRPTDNARQERWYRTVKQEEIYCYPTYPTFESARSSLSRHIDFYNEYRPHQALWNFTPGFVHRTGNKSEIQNLYKRSVQIAKEQRKTVNRLRLQNNETSVLN